MRRFTGQVSSTPHTTRISGPRFQTGRLAMFVKSCLTHRLRNSHLCTDWEEGQKAGKAENSTYCPKLKHFIANANHRQACGFLRQHIQASWQRGCRLHLNGAVGCCWVSTCSCLVMFQVDYAHHVVFCFCNKLWRLTLLFLHHKSEGITATEFKVWWLSEPSPISSN